MKIKDTFSSELCVCVFACVCVLVCFFGLCDCSGEK